MGDLTGRSCTTRDLDQLHMRIGVVCVCVAVGCTEKGRAGKGSLLASLLRLLDDGVADGGEEGGKERRKL